MNWAQGETHEEIGPDVETFEVTDADVVSDVQVVLVDQDDDDESFEKVSAVEQHQVEAQEDQLHEEKHEHDEVEPAEIQVQRVVVVVDDDDGEEEDIDEDSVKEKLVERADHFQKKGGESDSDEGDTEEHQIVQRQKQEEGLYRHQHHLQAETEEEEEVADPDEDDDVIEQISGNKFGSAMISEEDDDDDEDDSIQKTFFEQKFYDGKMESVDEEEVDDDASDDDGGDEGCEARLEDRRPEGDVLLPFDVPEKVKEQELEAKLFEREEAETFSEKLSDAKFGQEMEKEIKKEEEDEAFDSFLMNKKTFEETQLSGTDLDDDDTEMKAKKEEELETGKNLQIIETKETSLFRAESEKSKDSLSDFDATSPLETSFKTSFEMSAKPTLGSRKVFDPNETVEESSSFEEDLLGRSGFDDSDKPVFDDPVKTGFDKPVQSIFFEKRDPKECLASTASLKQFETKISSDDLFDPYPQYVSKLSSEEADPEPEGDEFDPFQIGVKSSRDPFATGSSQPAEMTTSKGATLLDFEEKNDETKVSTIAGSDVTKPSSYVTASSDVISPSSTSDILASFSGSEVVASFSTSDVIAPSAGSDVQVSHTGSDITKKRSEEATTFGVKTDSIEDDEKLSFLLEDAQRDEGDDCDDDDGDEGDVNDDDDDDDDVYKANRSLEDEGDPWIAPRRKPLDSAGESMSHPVRFPLFFKNGPSQEPML